MLKSILVGIIPAIISGLALWYIKKLFDKREVRDEAREQARIKNNVLLLKGISVSLELGEVTADAVVTKMVSSRMVDAREAAKHVKHEIDDFTREQGSTHIA